MSLKALVMVRAVWATSRVWVSLVPVSYTHLKTGEVNPARILSAYEDAEQQLSLIHTWRSFGKKWAVPRWEATM